MEELSGGGSRRPSRGADERKEKVAAEGVGQKKVAAEEKVALEEKVAAGEKVAKKVAVAEIVGKANPKKKRRNKRGKGAELSGGRTTL